MKFLPYIVAALAAAGQTATAIHGAPKEQKPSGKQTLATILLAAGLGALGTYVQATQPKAQ